MDTARRDLGFWWWLLAGLVPALVAAAPLTSHPPMRPLPEPSARPLEIGPGYFVDPVRGSDDNDGSEELPWRSLARGIDGLSPGDTLYLRGGSYYESVTIALAGEPGKPITLRSYPGELAVLDGGYREFFEDPAGAWEPVVDGARGEFRSVRAYPALASPNDPRYPVFGSGVYSASVRVLGNFGDSMIPLHGYQLARDLRSSNQYWNLAKQEEGEEEIYVGPGLWLDPDSQRVHVRLAHTTLAALGENNYRGEIDPRELRLVVGGAAPVVDLAGARHLRLHGLAIRGTRGRTVNVDGALDVELDHVTVYGGAPALYVRATRGLRIVHSALRGISAPWSSRGSEKYRGISAYLFIAEGSEPQNEGFEVAFSEFSDCQDGLIIGTVDDLDFHHNLVDNFSDDALYLTPLWGKPGRGVRIHHNLIARCLICLSFAGEGAGQWDTPAFIYRNVFDLRAPIHYRMPASPEETDLPSRGRTSADHGGPLWKPMVIYHNTIVSDATAWRNHYGAGLSHHLVKTWRRLFNNIFVQTRGLPGLNLGPGDDELHADFNLHWGYEEGPRLERDFFGRFRAGPVHERSRRVYPPGWAANDLFADPLFVGYAADWTEPLDLRLQRGSPAIDAGLALPGEWPGARWAADAGKPDLGALPLGAEPWGVGIGGRIQVSGAARR